MPCTVVRGGQRADARRDAGVCAASIGHTRGEASPATADRRRTAKQRLTQMDVGLDQAGEDIPPRASMTRSCGRPGPEPIEAIRPSRIDTSPSTTSRRSFIVTMVASRMRSDGIKVRSRSMKDGLAESVDFKFQASDFTRGRPS